MPQHPFPTIITFGNFACGVFSIFVSLLGEIELAILFICMGGFFDLLDGWFARKMNAVSMFGKELDSLADLITFGISPAIIAFELQLSQLGYLGIIFVLFYSASAAFRLARFNTCQSELPTFVGLPVPAAAYVLLISTWFTSTIILSISICILSYLMISKIRIPHMKNKMI